MHRRKKGGERKRSRQKEENPNYSVSPKGREGAKAKRTCCFMKKGRSERELGVGGGERRGSWKKPVGEVEE